MNKRISINFCGGCNPRIDRGQIATKVRIALEASGDNVFYNMTDVDFVIFMSGCTAGCALKYTRYSGPYVAVAAATLDTAAVEEEMLVTKIVTKVRNYFEKLERDLQK
jgi:hypothetical protein